MARKTGGITKGYEYENTRIRKALQARFLQRVEKIADKVFDAHEALALGHYVEVHTEDGQIRVYKKSPNGEALRWMQEHVWGLAPLKIDLEAHIEVEQTLTDEQRRAIQSALAYALPANKRTHDLEGPSVPLEIIVDAKAQPADAAKAKAAGGPSVPAQTN